MWKRLQEKEKGGHGGTQGKETKGRNPPHCQNVTTPRKDPKNGPGTSRFGVFNPADQPKTGSELPHKDDETYDFTENGRLYRADR